MSCSCVRPKRAVVRRSWSRGSTDTTIKAQRAPLVKCGVGNASRAAFGDVFHGVNPGQGPVNPGQGPVNPGQGPVNPGQGPVNPGQGPVNPGQGPVNPSQPGSSPVDPG